MLNIGSQLATTPAGLFAKRNRQLVIALVVGIDSHIIHGVDPLDLSVEQCHGSPGSARPRAELSRPSGNRGVEFAGELVETKSLGISQGLAQALVDLAVVELGRGESATGTCPSHQLGVFDQQGFLHELAVQRQTMTCLPTA